MEGHSHGMRHYKQAGALQRNTVLVTLDRINKRLQVRLFIFILHKSL